MASKKGPSCYCVEHNTIANGDNPKVVRLSSKKIKVGTINYMQAEGLIPKHALAVCEACSGHAEKMLQMSNKRLKVEEYGILINKIEKGEIANEVLISLCEAIGKSVSQSIVHDGNSISDTYMDSNFADNFTIKQWLCNRNNVLVKFLMACANMSNFDNMKKNICLMGSVDSLYKARVLNLVTPVPFFKNLLSYYISGSSHLARLNCTYSPAGSYSCLKNWLNKHSSSPVEKPLNDNDSVIFFDNNQVVARNWRITYNYKSTASVITTLAHIQPSTPSHLQVMQQLSPRSWLYKAPDDTIRDKVYTIVKSSDSVFDNIRNQFVANRLSLLESQQAVINGKLIDVVDKHINDNAQPTLTPSMSDPYSWVKSEHGDTKPIVSVGEPSMLNPCSFDSVSKVLTHIQEQSNGLKEWIVVGCDGLPYTLAQKLIPKQESLQNILLVPGNGHIEMNATKAIFRLLWDVVLEDLAKLNGFRSPRALLAAHKCSDHHKSWSLLMAFFHGTLDELLTTYVKSCYGRKAKPDVTGFYLYIQEAKSPNYRFIADIILNYVLALFVFRCGVRRGNYKFIESGRNKIMKIFYGLNMPNYQFLTYCDLKMRVLAPPEVLTFIQQTESFSVTGDKSKGEGGDFILESINARTKRWLPPGVPTEKHWKEVCRNVDKMEQIRDKLHTELCIRRKKPTLYQRDMSMETFQWRARLRKCRYLDNSDNINKPHTSISGVVLDRGLIGFETQCCQNFKIYMDAIHGGHQPGKQIKLTPIFTTVDDRDKFHDIRNQTKPQISDMIENCITEIAALGYAEEALTLERQWRKIKVGTKDALLQFYREVTTAIQDASNTDDEEETDSGDSASEYE